MAQEEEAPVRRRISLGDDLSALSIGDLEEREEELRAEIVRVQETLKHKRSASDAAEAVFGKG